MEEDDLALASLILALADMGISAEEGARVFRQGARTVQEAVGVLNGEGLRPAVLAADNLNDNWEEHFAADPINCPYYYETQTQTTQWEEPAHVRRKRLQLASEVFAVDISRLERVDGILQGSHDSSIYSPQAGGQVDNFVACIFTLRRIFENIVDSPAQDKYRTLRKQNAKFSKVWALPAVRRLLSEVGFIEISETVALPMAADLGPLRFAASRLQLAEAVEVASSSGRAELHREGVMPAGLTEEEARAARWQHSVHHCGRCRAFIHDGSEKLWTGKHDAPNGQFRYQCNQCKDFSVCEKCWDTLQEGKWKHGTPEHSFQHIHPITSRHNTTIHGQGPWGNFGASISGRARERLRERTGL